MPLLDQHQSNNCTKLLLMGDSGTGKTGALASLVKDGYNLRIMDFDNGIDILANILRGTPFIKQVSFHTLTDEFHAAGFNLIPKTATAWGRAVKFLKDWEEGLGDPSTWGSKDILVVDSLTFAGKSAMRWIQQLNGRLAAPPQIQDFRDGQTLVENLCATLFSDTIKCNVIALTHVRTIGDRHDVVDDKGKVRTIEDASSRKGFPETGAGRALSPNIGRYFNAVLLADIQGSGQATRRIIRTVPHENIGLKNSAPGKALPQYPLDTGLAEYFKAVRG